MLINSGLQETAMTDEPEGSAIIPPGHGNDALSAQRPHRTPDQARREVMVGRLRRMLVHETDTRRAMALSYAITELEGATDGQ
jgi:hypothetical protein